MSDSIKHECAVTMLRLRKEPEFYRAKYHTDFYGVQKLSLLLEKQHNRGQDGAGIAGIRLHPEPGSPAFRLEKSASHMPLADLVERIGGEMEKLKHLPEQRAISPLAGELFLGHLRYGTFGMQGECACHPFVRESACLNRTLLLAGNFNLTNTAEIFETLLRTGHHPGSRQDGALILHLIGHTLEQSLAAQPGAPPDFPAILRCAAENFDGAFTLCGVLADGNAFALRDPIGIRPAFYYIDDEVAVVASERPAIQTAFDLMPEAVRELPPGHALVVSPDGTATLTPCLAERPRRSCVFERIYFSRGNDAEIHHERKTMGRMLLPAVLDNLADGVENAFFSYIPNTAQISFMGLVEALMEQPRPTPARFGQIAVKDAKFRTFIADAVAREDFYMHVYDVTYGLLRPGLDTLVVLDDSIVRGNTMRKAILPILDRLSPKRIVIASAAPPIRYPDCYGIDMGSLRELVAFESAVDLLRKHGRLDLLDCSVEAARRALESGKAGGASDPLREIYGAFSDEEHAAAIADRLRPPGLKAELRVVFQRCDALRQCCPGHSGDWYFTGNYPTPGGCRVVNQALVNYIENKHTRAY